MNKELREAVAAAMYEAYRDMYNDDLKPWGEAGPGIKSVYHHKADAAISIIRPAVLEEAAKVIEPKGEPCGCVEQGNDGFWYNDCGCGSSADYSRMQQWCSDKYIASAIRALAKEGE